MFLALPLLMGASVGLALGVPGEDVDGYRSFAEETSLGTVQLGEGWPSALDWGLFHESTFIMSFRGAEDGQHPSFCMGQLQQEGTTECKEVRLPGFDDATTEEFFFSPKVLEVIERENRDDVAVYVLDSGKMQNDECFGAKVAKLQFNGAGEFTSGQATFLSGMQCTDGLIYSLSIDPDEEFAFISQVDEEHNVTNFFFADISQGQTTVKDLSANWNSSTDKTMQTKMNYILGTTLTQKYSLVAWSPSKSGNLYMCDKYYIIHSDRNGLYKGKDISQYSELRSESNSYSDRNNQANYECSGAISLTSDHNDNIYFLHKPAKEESPYLVKLWKGTSCVTIHEISSAEDSKTISNNIHIANEKIMYLTQSSSQNPTTYEVHGIFIGANSYSYRDEHYAPVVDEGVFIGVSFGTFFGALLLGVVVMSIRLLLAKRNR